MRQYHENILTMDGRVRRSYLLDLQTGDKLANATQAGKDVGS